MKVVTSPKSIKKKLDNFFEGYKTIYFKKGDILLNPNDKIKDIFYIKKGYVRVYSTSVDGREVTLHVANPGTFFPAMLALPEIENRYFWQALIPVEIKRAPKDEVIHFVKNDAEVLFDLTLRFGAGISGLLERIEKTSIDSAHAKIISLLSYFALKYGKKENKKIHIPLEFTHGDLATWTGLNRETVTRKIKSLKKEKLIEYKKRKIVIVDIKRLQSDSF